MPVYHFHRSIISRGKGHSVVKCAAYISGERLYDLYTGKKFDYQWRKDMIYRQIFLPKEAPNRLTDRQRFYDELNRAERRRDAQMAIMDDLLWQYLLFVTLSRFIITA